MLTCIRGHEKTPDNLYISRDRNGYLKRQCKTCLALWGKTRTSRKRPEYRSWWHMRTRCYDQRSPAYHRYGGRGIVMCERWRDSYANFLADMGPRPTAPGKWSIDRIDNDGPYSPENCRWATHSQQQRNRGYRGQCGEGNGSAKLTEQDVVLIRATARPGRYSKIARQFNVSNQTVRDIAIGKTWRLLASPGSPQEKGKDDAR